MKLLLVLILAVIGTEVALAETGVFVEEVNFIQYLDENTALEEVRNGNLDLYYYRIPSDRVETSDAREGLKIYESTGGSYSILVNPAESESFNPFSIPEVRFALNYLVDRKLIVNELMGGYGTVMISNYGPFDPDYMSILDELESFHFRYNPVLSESLISDSLSKVGSKKVNGYWTLNGKEIEIVVFIRSDDPVRKSIGEILSSELEKLGFKVIKDFGDLNKAFAVVYGSNPADMKWHLYTEGWGGRSAFVKYDSVGLGQMYSPWFSNMPGFNDPSYWNYNNDFLDSVTQKIYTGNFTSSDERDELIRIATTEGVNESVRIFLASKIDQYVVNESISGVINDFGAGVPSRFTPINTRTDSNSVTIGVKQIYQGAWNPIGGISDVYSRHIWDVLYDPGVFMHPYTGDIFPIRADWEVETAGPLEKIDVPEDAIIWDTKSQKWQNVKAGTQSTSKVIFDLGFSNWHNKRPMDMNDILYSLYFTLEWGSEPKDNDKTFDPEFSPRQLQTTKTIVCVRQIDNDSIEVYVDYWHFDESEIASWASLWSSMPWEIMYAMEQSVIDGKLSYSRSGAVSKSVNWLSLIVPHDSSILKEYLQEFSDSNSVPSSLRDFELDSKYFKSRYESSIDWIDKNDHAIISNGPFYLDSYSPESRTIRIKAFVDASYPFEAGHWSKFEEVNFPQILHVDLNNVVSRGNEINISVKTKDSSELRYFFTNSQGLTVFSGIQKVEDDVGLINLSGNTTSNLSLGANDLKIFAISQSVLRPDIFSTSFLVVDAQNLNLPDIDVVEERLVVKATNQYEIIALLIGLIIIGIIIFYKKKSRTIS